MSTEQIVLIALKLGAPLAESIFGALKNDRLPTKPDGTAYTWDEVAALIAEARQQAQAGAAIAHGELDPPSP